ncbi:MAG TPA: hypothetical protein VGQ41_01470 [Pyrinomonadaceae bacterium]|nr:hypothetical protein [Pyrinomonadaceae bacterium]
MRTTLPFCLLLVVVSSCGLPAQTKKNPLRPSELVENAKSYLNQTIDLEILEPLYGPSKPEDLARVEYGQVEIRIPEGMSGTLSLVPAAFKPTDPNRYRNKFDRVIESPVKVRGELLSDDEMSKATRRPAYVVRVLSMEPIVMGPPHRVASLNVIKSDPAQWDRKQIVYDGIYQTGFEVSALDEIWLDLAPNAKIIKPANVGEHANRVRVTGILFARPGAHYGHLGGYSFQLTASKIEYLEAVR